MQTIKNFLLQIPDGIAREAATRAMADRFSNQPIFPATLAINGAANPAVKSTGLSFFLVNGILVKLAANQVMPALTGLVIANTFKGIALFVTDVNGTLTTIPSLVTSTSVAALQFPVPPQNTVVIGYIIVENNTGGTFTGGATALDTGSLVVTYVNEVDGLFALNSLTGSL